MKDIYIGLLKIANLLDDEDKPQYADRIQSIALTIKEAQDIATRQPQIQQSEPTIQDGHKKNFAEEKQVPKVKPKNNKEKGMKQGENYILYNGGKKDG